MTTSRRDLLKGALATAAVSAVPFAAIAGLTPVVTLGQLAADGKYANSETMLPEDIHDQDRHWKFSLKGKPVSDRTFIKEIYAPGDDTGWAVLYVKTHGGPYKGETELVRGRWKMWRVPAPA